MSTFTEDDFEVTNMHLDSDELTISYLEDKQNELQDGMLLGVTVPFAYSEDFVDHITELGRDPIA